MSSEHTLTKLEKVSHLDPVSLNPPPAVSVSKLHLELPKFSGKPTDWFNFHALFTAAIDRQGTGLTEPERCCLLANAMLSEEARRVVEFYQAGKNGYDSAMKALKDAYGQPQLVYPHHVRQFITPDRYSYTCKSLRHMREKIEINMHGMERAGGATFQQFLAAIIMEGFDEKVRHEWTSNYSDINRFPNIEEILTFFRQREFSLPEKPFLTSSVFYEPVKSCRTSKPSNLSKKTRHHTVLKVSSTGFNTCPICNAEHSLSRCSTFLGYNAAKRIQTVRDHKRCTNCLLASHICSQCTSAFNC